MPYIFSCELTANEGLTELTASLARGNHKSATDELEQVKQLISKDVIHGFSVPFPASTVTLLPSPVVTPLGLAKQWTPRQQRQTRSKVSNDARSVFLVIRPHPCHFHQQTNQHDQLPRNDIWLVLRPYLTLHRLTTVSSSTSLDIDCEV